MDDDYTSNHPPHEEPDSRIVAWLVSPPHSDVDFVSDLSQDSIKETYAEISSETKQERRDAVDASIAALNPISDPVRKKIPGSEDGRHMGPVTVRHMVPVYGA